MSAVFVNAEALRAAFAAARASGKRAKEAAESIGSSEGAAVAAHCGDHAYPPKAIALAGPWIDLLKALEPCGPLMGLTRNASTVHEKTGVYSKLSAMGQMGLALGEDIDLRIFFSQWHAGFAVTELAANPQNRPNVSLQFFDAHGLAVHKIFQRDATDRAAFDAVVQRFTAAASHTVFTPAVPAPAAQPDADIDVAGLTDAWAALQDTHEFFGLLKKFDAERQQSLRLVQGRFTQSLSTMAPRELLQSASFDGVPIMVFVGSRGCIQIHTGPVKRIEPMDIRGVQWLNVIDPTFNLHLREDSIAHVWRVEKPTADGVVTSVEVFDHAGELMAMFFGARKPGQPELQSWRDLVAGLPALHAVPA
ncbi:MAG: ChuX/HutX family heme-like substrate-binding protein [Rhodoferax sp.]|uniref:hemin-degrading factor n=1 Tax=Rhodoferax sp. TaxID=50421 RepID=UPI003266A606